MTPVAVCLMTCDRPAYTRRTVESFLACNVDLSGFTLLHGDDGSVAEDNFRLARAAGFQTVVHHTFRCGTLATRLALIEAAAHFAPWVLVLENDMESVRTFPWPLFEAVADNQTVYCLRLFGRFKDALGLDPCKVTHQWKHNRPVKWHVVKGAPEPAEIGAIHWSAQPSVTRVPAALALHRRGHRDLGLTVRVVNNVMVHIGTERTTQTETPPC